MPRKKKVVLPKRIIPKKTLAHQIIEEFIDPTTNGLVGPAKQETYCLICNKTSCKHDICPPKTKSRKKPKCSFCLSTTTAHNMECGHDLCHSCFSHPTRCRPPAGVEQDLVWCNFCANFVGCIDIKKWEGAMIDLQKQGAGLILVGDHNSQTKEFFEEIGFKKENK